MAKNNPGPSGQNNLLVTMSVADREMVEPHLTPVELSHGLVLEVPGQDIETVYFPTGGVGSMIAIGAEGRRIEAGLFGREGVSGLPVLMGNGHSPHETLIQVPGHARAIGADRLREMMDASATLRQLLLRYAQTLLTQATHTALSNGHAKLEERLARWLLMCHDRIDGDRLDITHEFLSVMLGVRRAGVTVGTHILEGKGLIRAERGRITVRDRAGLEREARGSYGVPEAEYARLIG